MTILFVAYSKRSAPEKLGKGKQNLRGRVWLMMRNIDRSPHTYFSLARTCLTYACIDTHIYLAPN